MKTINHLTKEQIKQLKYIFPKGSRIVLHEMVDDVYPLKPGTEGTVVIIDAYGQIHVSWDNGVDKPVDYGKDRFSRIM